MPADVTAGRDRSSRGRAGRIQRDLDRLLKLLK